MTIAIVAARRSASSSPRSSSRCSSSSPRCLEGLTVGARPQRDPRSAGLPAARGLRSPRRRDPADVAPTSWRSAMPCWSRPAAASRSTAPCCRGHSFVDQARITGESMPVEKTAGTHVFAGSINQSGALEVRAERIGRDTSYGKIIEAVEQRRALARAGPAPGRPAGRLSRLLRPRRRARSRS